MRAAQRLFAGVNPVYLRHLAGDQPLATVALIALSNDQQVDCRSLVEGRDFLTNPDWAAQAAWSQLERGIPRPKSVGERRDLSVWWRDGDDLVFSSVWPPRSKMDLAIRRTRSSDLWMHAKRTGCADLLPALNSLAGSFDYISVLNLGWAYCVMGRDWWQRMSAWGAFLDGIEHYVQVCKYVSDYIKTQPFADANRFDYVEAAGLVGYRNPPFPGFDVLLEAEKLAHAGTERTLPEGMVFADVAREALAMRVDAVQWVSFDDYVLQTKWLTSGASSQGRLEFRTPDGQQHSVKARKNFLPDVMPLPELVALAKSREGQAHTTIVKSELGKIRLAVAADIEGYLKMSWVNYLLNGAYRQWPGSTIDESTEVQTDRMITMLELCARSYGLPFDYAAFDHQPSTAEIKVIVQILCDAASANVPAAQLPAFRVISRSIVDSYDNAELTARDGEQKRTFHVEGGLMSGLRWTSVVGNAWNTVMTACVSKLLAGSGCDVGGVRRYIRGDDSAIFTPTAALAMLYARGYEAVGVEGGKGKFSVKRHEMEFLRVWYAERCHGYVLRALPGITQRKPWSSAPWSEEMTLTALSEVCRTLRRRGKDVAQVWLTLSAHWCSLHRLPRAICCVPRALGGLGLEPWDGRSLLSHHLPRIDKTGIEVTNMTDWRERQLATVAAEEGIVLDAQALKRVAQRQLMDVIAADDIPNISREYRQAWKRQVAALQIRVVKKAFPAVVARGEALPTFRRQVGEFGSMKKWLADRRGTFASCQKDVNRLSSVRELLRESGETVRSWIRRTRYRLDLAVRRFRGHMGEALDWLGGTVPMPFRSLHPSLAGMGADLAASWVRSQRTHKSMGLHAAFSLLTPGVEAELLCQPLIHDVYSW